MKGAAPHRRSAAASPWLWRELSCWIAIGAAVWLAIVPQGRASPRDNAGDGKRDGITILLPPRLAGGENATLAVLAPNGKLVPNVTVTLSSGMQVTTDSTGRALFEVPADARVLLAHAAMGGPGIPRTPPIAGNAYPKGEAGEIQAAVVVPGMPRPLQIVSVPPWVGMRDRFAIRGFGFMGDAAANKIFISGQPRMVLASSSLALVVAGSVKAEPGPGSVVVQTRDAAASATLTQLELEMASGPESLAPGKNGVLEFRVTGTDQPRALDVRNFSSDVLRLLRGNFQRVESSGGAQNSIAIAARGLHNGDFSVDVRLVPAVQAPDIEAAKAFLEAVLARSDHNHDRRIIVWIAELGEQDKIESMTEQIEKTANHTSDADTAALIRAARDALRGTEK